VTFSENRNSKECLDQHGDTRHEKGCKKSIQNYMAQSDTIRFDRNEVESDIGSRGNNQRCQMYQVDHIMFER
jgi:hypothetical protein